MDMDAPPTEYDRFIRRLHPILQIALRYKAAAIKATDIEESLRLYALACKYLIEAASVSPQAAFLLADAHNCGGWGAFEPVIDEAIDFDRAMSMQGSYREFVQLLEPELRGVTVDQAMQDACNGDIISLFADVTLRGYPEYEQSTYMFNDWYEHPEFGPVLGEFGLCPYSEYAPVGYHRKYVTGLNIDIVSNYACESDSAYMYMFKVIVQLLRQNAGKKRVEYVGRIFEFAFNNTRTDLYDMYEYTLGYFATNTSALLRDKYMRRSWILTKLECVEFYKKRLEEYRRAAITWMLCAREFVYRDIAVLIGKLVYESRLEF